MAISHRASCFATFPAQYNAILDTTKVGKTSDLNRQPLPKHAHAASRTRHVAIFPARAPAFQGFLRFSLEREIDWLMIFPATVVRLQPSTATIGWRPLFPVIILRFIAATRLRANWMDRLYVRRDNKRYWASMTGAFILKRRSQGHAIYHFDGDITWLVTLRLVLYAILPDFDLLMSPILNSHLKVIISAWMTYKWSSRCRSRAPIWQSCLNTEMRIPRENIWGYATFQAFATGITAPCRENNAGRWWLKYNFYAYIFLDWLTLFRHTYHTLILEKELIPKLQRIFHSLRCLY